MMKPCRIQAISLTLAGRLSLAARAKVIPGCILALLMVLTGLRLEAQPRDAELRFHVGTGAFYDSSQQLSAGSSYRHYFGERGWAIEPEYSLMTEKGHQDHMLVLNAVKDLTLPSRKAGLYTIMGAGVYFHRKDTPYAAERSGTVMNFGWGMGLKVWAGDRFFIAPQFRIGEPFKLSINFGLARRR